jgi:hypothetical protein
MGGLKAYQSIGFYFEFIGLYGFSNGTTTTAPDNRA